MGCITGAKYDMLCDHKVKTTSRNDFGEVEVSWSTQESAIECYVESLSAQGLRGMGSGEQFNRDYKDVEYLRMLSSKRFTKADRIGNIRTSDGTVVYRDSSNNARDFHVQGVNPVVTFGKIIEYEYILMGVDNTV